MPELLPAKGPDGMPPSRTVRFGSGSSNDSETSPNNSATGSKVWGDSVLSTNHEAAIDDCNGDGMGITSCDEGEEDSDDGMTDIR